MTDERLDRLDAIFGDRITKTDGCWLWQGHTVYGYGSMRVGRGRQRGVHRIAWESVYGPVPDGLWVLHRCDVRNCVRPDHLFLGTNADNTADRVAKGRNADQAGERSHRARLTPEIVREIRASNEINIVLASRYGVSKEAVRAARVGDTWSNVR